MPIRRVASARVRDVIFRWAVVFALKRKRKDYDEI
jgi:hypothetical protein